MVRPGIYNQTEGEDAVTEFWNEMMTQASWEKLQELSDEFEFVLIGGWAAYLWCGMHKSKDIDIIVDYETLPKIQERYPLTKNDRLKKYRLRNYTKAEMLGIGEMISRRFQMIILPNAMRRLVQASLGHPRTLRDLVDFLSRSLENKYGVVEQAFVSRFLKTEGIDLIFDDDAVSAIAEIATEVNARTENIGARRLHTVMERLLDEISFQAPDLSERRIVIDAKYVYEKLQDIKDDEDLSRYIL